MVARDPVGRGGTKGLCGINTDPVDPCWRADRVPPFLEHSNGGDERDARDDDAHRHGNTEQHDEHSVILALTTNQEHYQARHQQDLQPTKIHQRERIFH